MRRDFINLQIHFDNMKKDKDLQIASLERIIKEMSNKLEACRKENKDLDTTLSDLVKHYLKNDQSQPIALQGMVLNLKSELNKMKDDIVSQLNVFI